MSEWKECVGETGSGLWLDIRLHLLGKHTAEPFKNLLQPPKHSPISTPDYRERLMNSGVASAASPAVLLPWHKCV